jgi:hypothetical protein
MIIWYRINTNYYAKDYDNKALDVSDPAGNDKQKAIAQYYNELAKNEKCVDDPTQPTRIDLTEYICQDNESMATSTILLKNY